MLLKITWERCNGKGLQRVEEKQNEAEFRKDKY